MQETFPSRCSSSTPLTTRQVFIGHPEACILSRRLFSFLSSSLYCGGAVQVCTLVSFTNITCCAFLDCSAPTVGLLGGACYLASPSVYVAGCFSGSHAQCKGIKENSVKEMNINEQTLKHDSILSLEFLHFDFDKIQSELQNLLNFQQFLKTFLIQSFIQILKFMELMPPI